MNLNAYLRATTIINWQHPTILDLAEQLSQKDRSSSDSPTSLAKSCFEWVRDRIRHSVDYQLNPVTCRASDVLEYKTGYCFAKSHLLAALLRANDIPTGFCYQRLSLDDQGPPYSLHGFNAVCLEDFGWYRVDPRGNRDGIDAQFQPPHEQLAYAPRLPGEVDFPDVLTDPLPSVVEVLESCDRWDQALSSLPDVTPGDWAQSLQSLGG